MSEAATNVTNMEYRYLGKSGMKVSTVGLGTMTFGKTLCQPLLVPTCEEDLSHQIMNRYVELGGNFLDTADKYLGGASEEVIGRWLERREREDIVLATKVRHDMGCEKNVNNVGLSRRHITNSINKSLQRLHTDYVDLYQIHFWDAATGIEETLRTLDDLIRCGKVLYVGASNLTGWQMQKVVETSKYLGLNPFVSLQQEYSLLNRWSEVESFQVCKMEGLGVIPWSPLKGGLLTDKYKRNTSPKAGSRLGWVAEDEKTRATVAGPAWSTISDATFDILETAERIGKEKGKSTAQVALRWLLQKDVVSSVIIGATKISQLEDNMQAASGWTLSPEEMQRLDKVSQIDLPHLYQLVSKRNGERTNPFSVAQHVSST